MRCVRRTDGRNMNWRRDPASLSPQFPHGTGKIFILLSLRSRRSVILSELHYHSSSWTKIETVLSPSILYKNVYFKSAQSIHRKNWNLLLIFLKCQESKPLHIFRPPILFTAFTFIHRSMHQSSYRVML